MKASKQLPKESGHEREPQAASLKEHLITECLAMVKYLSADGNPIPKDAQVILNWKCGENQDLNITDERILQLHALLARKVAPARPSTILLLFKESKKGKIWTFLGAVGLVRRLMMVTIVSLVVFIGVSLSPDINVKNIHEGIFNMTGWKLFQILIFFLASASLGGCFSNLFEANKYITAGTYNVRYEPTYWIRYILGVIAGLILAVLFPVPDHWADGQGLEMQFFSIPLLAMLGGFSASLFYRVLNRFVTTVETLLTGKTPDEPQTKENSVVNKQKEELVRNKKELVDQLLALKSEIPDPKVNKKLTETIDSFLMN